MWWRPLQWLKESAPLGGFDGVVVPVADRLAVRRAGYGNELFLTGRGTETLDGVRSGG
ncbi:hypothetical protein GCM10009743_01080 [Kribbella swartbergensis]